MSHMTMMSDTWWIHEDGKLVIGRELLKAYEPAQEGEGAMTTTRYCLYSMKQNPWRVRRLAELVGNVEIKWTAEDVDIIEDEPLEEGVEEMPAWWVSADGKTMVFEETGVEGLAIFDEDGRQPGA